MSHQPVASNKPLGFYVGSDPVRQHRDYGSVVKKGLEVENVTNPAADGEEDIKVGRRSCLRVQFVASSDPEHRCRENCCTHTMATFS